MTKLSANDRQHIRSLFYNVFKTRRFKPEENPEEEIWKDYSDYVTYFLEVGIPEKEIRREISLAYVEYKAGM